MKHVKEIELALYASGDLNQWKRVFVRAHARGCEQCSQRMAAYSADRQALMQSADKLPEGMEDLDWNALAAEMKANIRVGLAAGECVAQRERKPTGWNWNLDWRPAAVGVGAVALLAVAWVLNVPPSDNRSLGRAMTAILHGTNPAASRTQVAQEAPAVMQPGSETPFSPGSGQPVGVSVNSQGSASARYVDSKTGQLTIASADTVAPQSPSFSRKIDLPKILPSRCWRRIGPNPKQLLGVAPTSWMFTRLFRCAIRASGGCVG